MLFPFNSIFIIDLNRFVNSRFQKNRLSPANVILVGSLDRVLGAPPRTRFHQLFITFYIREYIHFKRRHNNKTRFNETSKKPSYVYQSKPVSSTTNPHNAYTKAIIDLNELLENSNEVIRPVVSVQPLLKHSITRLLDEFTN